MALGCDVPHNLPARTQDHQGPRAMGSLWLDPSPEEALAAHPLGSDPPFLLQQSWEVIQGQLCDLESCVSGSSALSLVQEYEINLQFYTPGLQVPYKFQCFSGASSLFGF